MGIYIKDMKMPEDCFGCPMVSGYEIADEARTMYSTVRCRLTNTRRPVGEAIASDCPLVPVPPHGRLIDADALMLQIQDYIEEYGETDEHGWHSEKWCAMKEAAMAIESAPTIIPAEPAEEGE